MSQVAHVRAAEVRGGAGQPLRPPSGMRNADLVVEVWRWRHIDHDHDRAAATAVGEDAIFAVIAHDPTETVLACVAMMQIRLAAVEPIERPDQIMDPLMTRVVQQAPIYASVVVPFRWHRQLATHEEQFLTRVGPHEGEIGPEGGQLAPRVPWCAPIQGPFAVNDFIV